MTAQRKKNGLKGRAQSLLLALALFAGTVAASPNSVLAACCNQNTCNCVENSVSPTIARYTARQFEEHERWLVDFFFSSRVVPALIQMAQELESAGMLQMMTLGAMLDAKHSLETQRLFQQLAAQAHKDYHPSEGLW